MRRVVFQPVGGAEVFQAQAGRAVFVLWPDDAFGTQRVGAAHEVENVPAATAVLPFAGVGVDEVAPEQVADEFVVKTQRVVARADGAGLRQGGIHGAGKSGFGQPVRVGVLRRDAGDQTGGGVGQVVVAGATEEVVDFAGFVQRGIGADGGKLRDAVQPRVGAEGFQVVPEKRECTHAPGCALAARSGAAVFSSSAARRHSLLAQMP